MRKIILYIATSLDGLIADKNGSTEWLHQPDLLLEGEDFGYTALMNRIDTTIMGNNTMKAILSFDIPFPYQQTENYVISREPERYEHPYATYLSDWKSKLDELKEQEGKDIWLIGGAKLNFAFLSENCIDEIILTLVPYALGEGIPLFEGTGDLNKFKLINSQPYSNGMVQLTYIPAK